MIQSNQNQKTCADIASKWLGLGKFVFLKISELVDLTKPDLGGLGKYVICTHKYECIHAYEILTDLKWTLVLKLGKVCD